MFIFTNSEVYSHDPYPSDGEDRQADGKDHPQRHDDHLQRATNNIKTKLISLKNNNNLVMHF